MLYGSRKTLDAIDEDKLSSVEDQNIISAYESKILELQKERQRFFDQRREFKKLVCAAAREEGLYDALTKAATQLNDTVGTVFDTGVLYGDYEDMSNEAILVLSDWHYGMTTRNVFNLYDKEICKNRIKEVAESAAERLSRHSCGRLHIVVLGDLIHGAIHTSARVASEELVCDQLMQVSELLAQTVEFLSKYVPETNVYVTYGNHARTVQVKQDNIHRDNMERLVPWWLGQRLKENKNIHVFDSGDTEFLLFRVSGKTFCAVHGDNDNVKDSPRLLTAMFQKKHDVSIDYILLGDKHHRESFEDCGVTALLCGSLCGTDEYANTKRLYSNPSQLLLIVTEENGVDAEYRIKPKQ